MTTNGSQKKELLENPCIRQLTERGKEQNESGVYGFTKSFKRTINLTIHERIPLFETQVDLKVTTENQMKSKILQQYLDNFYIILTSQSVERAFRKFQNIKKG